MKKLLGISLVAVLAVSPMMASAADTAPSTTLGSTNTTETQLAENGNKVIVANGAYYAGKTITEADRAAGATASFVKGAYNDAIAAVNSVHKEVTTLSGNAFTNAGDGLKADGANTVSVDLTANKGLIVDGTSKKLEIKNGNGIALGESGVSVAAKANGGIAVDNTGVSLNAKSNGGLTVDANGVSVTVDDSTIAVDSTTGAVKIKDGIQGTDANDYKDLKALTTQGYVDKKVADLNIGTYATQNGVEKTIKATTFTQGAVTQGLTGDVDTTTGTITFMSDWSDSSQQVDKIYIASVNKGDLATNVSVAAPTVNTVSYTEQ